MEENEHIDNHLKSSLDGYMVPPRISSFEDILNKMKRRRRRRFLIFFFPGLLFLIGGAILLTDYSGLSESLKQETLVSVSNAKAGDDSNTKGKENSPVQKPSSIDGSAPVQNTPSPAYKTDLKTKSRIEPKQKDPITKEPPLITGNSRSKLPVHENSTEKDPPLAKNASQADVSVSPVVAEPTGSDPLEVDFLEPKFVFLPHTLVQPGIVIDPLKENEPMLAGKDSVKKQKPRRFFIGPAFNPQLGSYVFQKNRNTWYDQSFATSYLKNKKEQNKITFNYAFGIKAGMILKEKWEIMAGFGFQKYTQKEKINTFEVIPQTNSSGTFLGANATFGDMAVQPGETYDNVFKYWDYSLELNRFFQLKNGLKTKLGLGFHSQKRMAYLKKGSDVVVVGEDSRLYLSDNRINTWQISPWLSTLHLKAGLIEDLNKTIQVQFCPTLAYSLNSMYAKNYLIKQRSIGLGLECLLLFKIR